MLSFIRKLLGSATKVATTRQVARPSLERLEERAVLSTVHGFIAGLEYTYDVQTVNGQQQATLRIEGTDRADNFTIQEVFTTARPGEQGVDETRPIGLTIAPANSEGTVGFDFAAGTEAYIHINTWGGADRVVNATRFFSNMNGGLGSDYLEGGSGRDVINGHGDNDTIRGNGGNDRLIGGTGNDDIRGGEGDDDIWGDQRVSNGSEWVSAGTGDDYLEGGNGADKLHGGGGADIMIGDSQVKQFVRGFGFQWISTEVGGNDELFGEDGNDTMVGGVGDDYLDGGKGEDWLFGGKHDDQLFGGDNNDHLYGGDGNDGLDGQSGEDYRVQEGYNDAFWLAGQWRGFAHQDQGNGNYA